MTACVIGLVCRYLDGPDVEFRELRLDFRAISDGHYEHVRWIDVLLRDAVHIRRAYRFDRWRELLEIVRRQSKHMQGRKGGGELLGGLKSSDERLVVIVLCQFQLFGGDVSASHFLQLAEDFLSSCAGVCRFDRSCGPKGAHAAAIVESRPGAVGVAVLF